VAIKYAAEFSAAFFICRHVPADNALRTWEVVERILIVLGDGHLLQGTAYVPFPLGIC